MKRVIAGTMALMATLVAHADQTDVNAWKRSDLYVTAAVDIDAQGKIQHLEFLPFKDSNGKDLQPALRSLAEATLAKWEFVPATVNGQAAPAHTFLHGVFEFREHGRDYDGRVVYVGNGPRTVESPAPTYPSDMVHARIQAQLSMLAMVQPDGSLTDIQLESAETTNHYAAASFVRSAKAAMAGWHAEPETVQGHPVKTWVRYPIQYDLRESSNGPRYAPELARSVDSPAAPKASGGGTEGLALDSPIKMRPQSP